VVGKAVPDAKGYPRLPLVHVAEGDGLTPALIQMLAALGVTLGPDETTVHWRIVVDVRQAQACASCGGRGEWDVMDLAGAWHAIPCPRCSTASPLQEP
jgi:hypothetical protein